MAEKKYINKDNLLYTWQKTKLLLKDKVDKVEGMTLSHNDLTDELKEKILKAGESSFSGNYTDLSNKPSINGHELAEGNNTLESLGIQEAVEGKGLSTKDFTAELETKLTDIEDNAQANKIEIINVNGKPAEISPEDKSVDLTIPKALSELTNDSSFQTSEDVDGKITTATADLAKKADIEDMATKTWTSGEITTATTDMATQTWVNGQIANLNKKQVVTSTEEMTDESTIYLLANSGSGNNIYDEYIVYNGTPEKIGTTEVDLTDYIKSSELVELTNEEIDEIFAS